jgi:hypothetical protein
VGASTVGTAAVARARAGEFRIELELLRRIERELPKATEGLDKAVLELVALEVAEASFTAFTYSLVVAYNEVEAYYTLRELRHRAEETVTIQQGVGRSAAAWEAAEGASAPRMV